MFEGDRGNIEQRMPCATCSLRLPRQRCSRPQLYLIAPQPRMWAHHLRPTVRLTLMARHPVPARHPPIVRLTSMAGHQPTVRHPATTHRTIMARHPITVLRDDRRTQFRLPLCRHALRYARRVISSGYVAHGAAGGGEFVIRSAMRDPTAATLRHLVRAITAPIEAT
jgi:hypothetical protein